MLCNLWFLTFCQYREAIGEAADEGQSDSDVEADGDDDSEEEVYDESADRKRKEDMTEEEVGTNLSHQVISDIAR